MASDRDAAKRILGAARTVAVLGASPRDGRPANYVPAYLEEQGFRVLPVNPQLEGQRLFGEVVRRTLAELGEPVDIIDVFRRSEDIPGHVEDILAMKPLPKVVWFQSGIVNDVVAATLEARGIEVVQDRCTYADHRRFNLPPVSRGEAPS